MTPEALDQWRWELAREVAYEGEIPEDAAWWIAASDHYRHLVREDVRPCVTQDNHKEAFETSDGISLNTKPETAEPVAQVQRRLFPVLGTKGAAKVDWQFVNDHAGQAYDNHYQTIERLAERGGLSWDELAAIIEGRKWHKMNITEAVETVRRAEAKYLSALYTHPAQTEVVEALEKADAAIREMFRYYDGGETRGSYDGKPERAQLRKAGYATTKALAALKGSRP
jgi:hypothetical protein